MILSCLRTILLYLLLVAVIRIMGKRQVGQLAPAEFVVTMLAANLVSIPMQDAAIPLYTGLVPILTVLSLELVLSFLMLCSPPLRRLLCGRPVILIENGRILRSNLRRTRITLAELLEHLREKDVLSPEGVQYAILETSGTLTVFPYPELQPPGAAEAGIPVQPRFLPTVLIQDGRLLRENLRLAGKDEAWLAQQLAQRGTNLRSTLLLTVDAAGKVCWQGREDGK